MNTSKIFSLTLSCYLIVSNWHNSQAQTFNRNMDGVLITIDTLLTVYSYERPYCIDKKGDVIILDSNGALTDLKNNKVLGFLPIQTIDLFVNDDYYICMYGTDDPVMTDSIVFYDKNFIHKKLIFERNKNMVFESEDYCPYSDLYQIFDVGKKSNEILCYYENCETNDNCIYLYDVFTGIETRFESKHEIINSPDGYYYSINKTKDSIIVLKYDSMLVNVFRFRLDIKNKNIGVIYSIINNRIIYSDETTGKMCVIEIDEETNKLLNKCKITDIIFNYFLQRIELINDIIVICGWAPNINNETFSDFETMPKTLVKICIKI